jgi:hypothetical protein
MHVCGEDETTRRPRHPAEGRGAMNRRVVGRLVLVLIILLVCGPSYG